MASGAAVARSSARSRGRVRTASTGSSAPVATSDASGPIAAMSAGAARAPRPSVASRRPSSAPRARPRTASGTARCMIVRAFTSTIELPMPSTARPPTATTDTGRPPIRASGSPNSARPKAKSRAIRPEEESTSAMNPPTSPPTPDRGVEQAHPRRVEVEQLERGDDDEDVQRPRDERLCAVEADEHPEGRLADDRRDARQDAGLAAARRVGGAVSRGASYRRRPSTRNGRPEEASGRSPRTRSRRW